MVGFEEERGKENGLMVEKNADKVNEVAKKMTEAVHASYETAVESTTTVQESHARLAQSLFESGVEALKIQTEIQTELRDQTLQSMGEQLRRHREVFQEVSRESLNAYEGFLGSLFSYYRDTMGESED
jgi:hypothetical protein